MAEPPTFWRQPGPDRPGLVKISQSAGRAVPLPSFHRCHCGQPGLLPAGVGCRTTQGSAVPARSASTLAASDTTRSLQIPWRVVHEIRRHHRVVKKLNEWLQCRSTRRDFIANATPVLVAQESVVKTVEISQRKSSRNDQLFRTGQTTG